MAHDQGGLTRWIVPGWLAASTIASGSGNQNAHSDDPPEPPPEK